MTRRRRSTGRFELPIPASEAIDYFTPEGERSWAPGWDPTYPAGQPTETPGTVFVTHHGDIPTVWIIGTIDRVNHAASYSRLTSGHHAGTVRVRCDDQADHRCVVSVEYDMTALARDPHALDAYSDEHFSGMIRAWQTQVGDALARDGRS